MFFDSHIYVDSLAKLEREQDLKSRPIVKGLTPLDFVLDVCSEKTLLFMNRLHFDREVRRPSRWSSRN